MFTGCVLSYCILHRLNIFIYSRSGVRSLFCDYFYDSRAYDNAVCVLRHVFCLLRRTYAETYRRRRVGRLARERGIRQDILLEVNIGGEEAKSGAAPEALAELAAAAAADPGVRLRGLMAIPPVAEKPGANRRYFEKMYQLYVDIKAKKYDNSVIDCLSMGMSGDFADAIAAGATMVRIGTAIFGARDYARR